MLKRFSLIKQVKIIRNTTKMFKNKPQTAQVHTTNSIQSKNKLGAAFRVLPSPIQSDSDKKEYKVIQLANGLTALLISDKSPIQECEIAEEEEMEESESEESSSEDSEEDESMDEEGPKRAPEQKLAAAGLCISVGSFSDPKEVPGMAHFLEHMVFMGSKKYPKENAFDEFIKLHGGSTNASTDAETTVFYFDCIEKHLQEALDIFAQFFIEPLMKKEAMAREKEAIESEFQMSAPSDSSRKEQLLCNLAKPDCPANGFTWGNLITLRDNINDEELYKGVHEFRKRHYSSHRMTLAIQARIDLPELENYVTTLFSNVPSNNLPPDDFTLFKNVFETPQFQQLYHIIPLKDLCQIDITWALPSMKNKYKSKPHHILSFLLGDEGKGSLLSYLKKKLWVIGTTIGSGDTGIEHNSLYTLFTVQMNLTEEGYAHVDEVIETFFSYIQMLRKAPPDERLFKELQQISLMGFKYASEVDAVDAVEVLCEAMQFYPPEDYIAGPELYYEFDPESVKQVLDQLRPEMANYMLIKQQLADETFQKEKWFGTQYKSEQIPDKWMDRWVNARINSELSIPPPNEFITTDFSILPEIDNPAYPQKIMDNEMIEIWYRRDTKFKLPTAYYYLYLISPLSIKSVKHKCMLDLMVNLLTLEIGEELYPATSADLSYTFTSYEKGLVVKLCGFNEKLPLLLDIIGKYLCKLHNLIDIEMFKAIKDKLLKGYNNKLLKPSSLAKDVRMNLLADKYWLPIESYTALQQIEFDDIKTYCKEYFLNLYVKCLVQGNVQDCLVRSTLEKFVSKLGYKEVTPNNRPVYKITRVDKGERCCRIKSFNPDDSNSIITNYYQSDKYNLENSVILDLIMMIIEEPMFDVLRTKEQLGYHVYGQIRDTFGVLGYTITVNAQATKSTTNHVDGRIEAFIEQSQYLLKNMKEEEFDKVKTNLIKMKQCADVHLKEEVDRNWSEITADDYIFNRISKEIVLIEKTTLQQVIQWWNRHNSYGSKQNFRKISIQIEGYKAKEKSPELELKYLGGEEEKKVKGETYFIMNIDEYKDRADVFSVK